MRNAAVDALLAVAVAAELACCLGVLAMRDTFDRIHYAGAATSVGPFCILAAVLVREGLAAQGLQAIVAVGLLFLLGPSLLIATARAARRIHYGDLTPGPEERRRGS